MLTVVPKKVFDVLNKQVSEAEPKKQKFDYEDFKKEVIHYALVNDYLKDKQIEFVGEGSGRIAYMIPKGGCIGREDSAVCLKVAKNVKGIAQNKAELQVIEKFGKEEPCFPKLFGTDKNENISMLCEIGYQVCDEEFEEYFEIWNDYARDAFQDETLENIKEIDCPERIFKALFAMKKIKKQGNAGKALLATILEDFRKAEEKYSEYEPFVSLFNVMFDKGAVYDVSLGDFGDSDNWGFVKRDGKMVLIPIDWGLTHEVMNQYYVD